MKTSCALSCALALAGLAPLAAADTITDTLEGLVPGPLPQSIWEDMSTRVAGHTVLPTANVISTLDAAGAETLAIQTGGSFGKSAGFHTPVRRASFHDLTADVRVDTFGDGAAWGMCVGFTTDDGAADINQSPQGLVYPWHDGTWHLFVTTPNGGDFLIQTPQIVLGNWYTIRLQVNTDTGFFNILITDTATGAIMGGGSITFPGFVDDYDSLSFFDGESDGTGTVSSATTIDNISYVSQGLRCPADLSGDGVVNGSDLAVLLAAWGTPDADLTGDGIADGSDLAVLLAAWGSCD